MTDRVLVVDDDPAIRMLYAEELSEAGYGVITCGDASILIDFI
jgi:DNA-binding response OmpR family regulator